MNDTKKVTAIAAGIIILLAAIGGGYYYLTSRHRAAAPAAAPGGPAAPVTEAAAPAGAEDLLKLPPLSLDESDGVLRQLLQDLSSHPRLFAWMKTSEILRKFVAAVDNIANGHSPKPQVDFFAPAAKFKAARAEGGRWVIDPASYERYNVVADVFVSLDSRASVRLYRSLKPLIDQAYRDLGYPEGNFDDTLVKAAGELLATPVVDGPVRVETKVATYALADPRLERLSAAQKQFLRFGPENVQVIQKKIREMAAILGVADSRLPKPRFYSAG